jgi:hypothetical protein
MVMTISTFGDYLELATRERKLSDLRRQLHNAIDSGTPTEWMLRREREVSDQRRALHRQIDELREELWPRQRPPAERPYRFH